MGKQHSPRFLALVNDAKKRITETTVDAVKARMDGGEPAEATEPEPPS